MSKMFDQQTIDQALAHDRPLMSTVLRGYRIDPTSRMSLADAAIAASVNPDELRAVIELRMRRAARKAQPAVETYSDRSRYSVLEENGVGELV